MIRSVGLHLSSGAARCALPRKGARSLRAETYPWREKGRSPAKRASNERLAQLARRLVAGAGDRPGAPPAHDSWALVLDAPSLATSRALRSAAGFRPERIVVPNDSDAAFGPASAAHALVLRGLSLGDFLRAGAPGGPGGPGAFACVFLDFTCGLDGSRRPGQELELEAPLGGGGGGGGSPREDLEALLGGGHLDPGGAVLGVTLAHPRDARRAHRGAEQWERLRALLGLLALRRGACAVALPPRVEQTAVASEFWAVGPPGGARFRSLVEAECGRWR